MRLKTIKLIHESKSIKMSLKKARRHRFMFARINKFHRVVHNASSLIKGEGKFGTVTRHWLVSLSLVLYLAGFMELYCSPSSLSRNKSKSFLPLLRGPLAEDWPKHVSHPPKIQLPPWTRTTPKPEVHKATNDTAD